MFLDAPDAGHGFRRNPQRLPLLWRLILRDPEMHGAVPDNNVLRPDFRPFLAAELGEEPLAQRAVVPLALAWRRTFCRPDRAHDIGPADDADDLAVAHHWHALDPLRLQQCRDVGEF